MVITTTSHVIPATDQVLPKWDKDHSAGHDVNLYQLIKDVVPKKRKHLEREIERLTTEIARTRIELEYITQLEAVNHNRESTHNGS